MGFWVSGFGWHDAVFSSSQVLFVRVPEIIYANILQHCATSYKPNEWLSEPLRQFASCEKMHSKSILQLIYCKEHQVDIPEGKNY